MSPLRPIEELRAENDELWLANAMLGPAYRSVVPLPKRTRTPYANEEDKKRRMKQSQKGRNDRRAAKLRMARQRNWPSTPHFGLRHSSLGI